MENQENQDYGYIKIKLNQLLQDKKLSKNKLAHRAEMQRTQLNKYCNNEVTRLDTAVLARICSVFGCRIEDLLEYIPAEEEDNS